MGGFRQGETAGRWVLCVVASLAVKLLVVGPASAQQAQPVPRSLSIERFHPMPTQAKSLLAVSTSEVLPHLTPAAGLVVHGADDSLQVTERRGGESQTIRLVDERLTGELTVALGLFDRFDLGFALPLVLQQGEALLNDRGERGELAGLAFGDMRVVPRVQLLAPAKAKGFGLALAAPTSIPVGDDTSYNSTGVFQVEPRFVADWRPFEGTTVAVNVGWQVRPERVAVDRVSDDAFVYGLGVEFPTGLSAVTVLGNLFGQVPVVGVSKQGVTATPLVEAMGAVRFDISERFTLQAGGGSGLTSAVGSPDARAVVGFEYAPLPRDKDRDDLVDRSDACPQKREDRDGYRDDDGCPDPDNDGDGVADAEDRCPDRGEDPDGYRDADGCPDPDNDGDGIADLEDACPTQKGIAEKDGCPFIDSDGDGIDDSRDANPNAAEDLDGFQDDDGVPDPDNDGDGIPDEEDGCPDAAETINGVDDGDGCPDEGDTKVEVTDEKIETDERIHFDSDRATIKQRSFSILEQVAAALKAHPEIAQVRIEGHTDGHGKDLYNLALSQRRANAVRAFLIDRGVAAARLESRGYGENEPIATNETKEGRSENRRVEITILQLKEGAE